MTTEPMKFDPREYQRSDALLSPSELQEWLGVGRTKVYSLLSTGEIPSIYIGRLRKIEAKSVTDFLEANRYSPGDRS